MSVTKLNRFLRRYTNLPALLYTLCERKLTLLDPQTWNDKNDSHYLSVYRDRNSLKCVLALCFTQISETYHHWRVFADGSSGVCISFHRDKLIAALQKQSGVTMKDVEYLKVKKLETKKLKIAELPFLKRYPYEDECEFRVLYESKTAKLNSLDIAIPLHCIDRIILSPWIPNALKGHVQETVHKIKGCKNIKVTRSTLISNERWKKFSDTAR
jgi:hypothetical protein